jgi:hypothetical protein
MAMCLQCFAQTKSRKPVATNSDILTDASIINLHKAGLDDDVIIAKVETSKTNFDLSTDKLIELKNAGISSAVIKALIDKGKSGGASIAAETAPRREPMAASSAALENLNTPYYYNKQQNRYMATEKIVASVKVKHKMLGYGGTSFLYEADGNRSPIRVTPQDDLSFMINTGGNPLPEFVLYKLKADGDKRDATSMEVKLFGGTKTPENVITYNTSVVKSGVYKITVSQRLAPGEYFFAGRPVTSGTSIDVFAFGVD